jgi:hypothetical protein
VRWSTELRFGDASAEFHFGAIIYRLSSKQMMPHTKREYLRQLIAGWKRFVAWNAKPAFKTSRAISVPRGFWQRDYWDTYMRDEEQERKAVRYIENNPTKARLFRHAADWPFSSARFRDAYHRLVLPN